MCVKRCCCYSLELGSTKEQFAELRHQNELLEMTMKKNLADLRQRLKASEEELLTKSIALKVERQKVCSCVCIHVYDACMQYMHAYTHNV